MIKAERFTLPGRGNIHVALTPPPNSLTPPRVITIITPINLIEFIKEEAILFKSKIFIFSFILLASLLLAIPSVPTDPGGTSQTLPEIANPALSEIVQTPISFVPNTGMADPRFLYFVHNARFNFGLGKTGVVFDSGGSAYRIEFPLAQEAVRVEARGLSPTVVNYFIGGNRERWQTNLKTYQSVLYENLFPGIDLKFYGRNRDIECDWTVRPGARVGDIHFQVCDVEKTVIGDNGDLLISTKNGQLIHKKPVSYQWIDGKRVDVPLVFAERGSNLYGFQAGPYDQNHLLIIDPVMLVFSTYLGGDVQESALSTATDSQGNIYVTGVTTSSTFPVKSPIQGSLAGESDIFITKYAGTGKNLVFSTYLGGRGADVASGIAVDSQGSVYLIGTTESDDFPVRNGYSQTLKGGKDVFIAKLNPSGTGLVFSTFLGGTSDEEGAALAIDKTRNILITGITASADFPVVKAFDKQIGKKDAFVAKLAANGRSLIFSTYLGGSGDDGGQGIATDDNGAAYVTGWTASSDFPVKNAFDRDFNGEKDCFVTRFSSGGSSLIFSTYLGGTGNDEGRAIALDSGRSAYVTGFTASVNFPVKGAFCGNLRGGKDIFVTKFHNTGQILTFSTYLGGSREDVGYDIEVDGTKAIYVAGGTASQNFRPSSSADKAFGGVQDGFLVKLDATGRTALCSYLLGGTQEDVIRGLALDKSGNVYLAGSTKSKNFPTKSAVDSTLTGTSDAFVAMLKEAQIRISSVFTHFGWGPPFETDVNGYGFGNSQGNKNLVVNGIPAPSGYIISWSDDEITCGFWFPLVWVDQTYNWAITENGKIVSNVYANRYLLYIDAVYPESGAPGTTVDIYYYGSYNRSWAVSFGGYDATWISGGSGHVQVTVPQMPAGATEIYFYDVDYETISTRASFTVL